MKKQAILLAALLAAASAQADVYATVAAGASHLNVDCTGATNCNTSDTGAKLAAGYVLGNGFSLEAGYISFGKFRANDATTSVSIKPTAFMLGGAFAVPMNSHWGMNVRLGIAQVKTKVDAAVGALSGSDSESKTKPYAGVGVTFAVSKVVKFELGLDSTQSEFAGEKATARLFSLGATFTF